MKIIMLVSFSRYREISKIEGEKLNGINRTYVIISQGSNCIMKEKYSSSVAIFVHFIFI